MVEVDYSVENWELARNEKGHMCNYSMYSTIM